MRSLLTVLTANMRMHAIRKTCIFTSNLLEDLKRRDFTINAMAYNDETGLVDAFDGIADLQRKADPMRGRTDRTFFGGCTAYAPCSPFCSTAWFCH